MRRHETSAPFDHDLAEAADITDEFWGESRGWQDRPTGRVERPSTLDRSPDDTTGAIRAIRAGVTAFRPQRVDRRDPSGSIRRTRAHGSDRAKRPAVPPTEATLGELADGRLRRSSMAVGPASSHDRFDWDFDTDEPHHDGFRDEIPLSPTRPAAGRTGLGGVDPLLARLGVLIVVGVMLVPVALALRPSDSADQTIRSERPGLDQTVVETDAPASGDAPLLDGSMAFDPVAAAEVSPGVETGSVLEPSTAASSSGEAAPSMTPAQVAAPESSAVEDDSAGDVSQSEPAEDPVVDALDEAATSEVEAERLLPDCSNTYAATPGDSWYAIAGAAEVAPSALLSQNNATTDTVILPGDEICLPPGASISVSTTSDAPAKSAAPATTNAPATTAAPKTSNAPATTAAPATAAPTTTTPTAGPASVERIKQMIRDTWPADQHEMAFFIANRESKFDPRADNNFCCYGVFQIYFDVHERWLDDFGVHTATDLFDANKNIAAAYEIYQRSGGWGPWGY